LNNNSFEKLRAMILESSSFIRVIDFTKSVFEGASNEPMILLANISCKIEIETIEGALISPSSLPDVESFLQAYSATVVEQLPGKPYLVRGASWLEKLIQNQDLIRFSNVVSATQGLRTGNNDKFLTINPPGTMYRKILAGSDIQRYAYDWPNTYVLYDRALLDAPRDDTFWNANERIIVQEIRNVHLPCRIVACYDDDSFIGLNTTNVIILREGTNYSLKFIMAILCSKLMNEYFRLCFVDNHIATQYIESIPIHSILFKTPEDERTAVVQTAQAHYEAGELTAVLAWCASELGNGRNDTIHDLLAYLAGQMIALNRAQQERVARFWLDLEGVLADPDTFAKLRHKGKWAQSLHKNVPAARPYVDSDSRSTISLDASLGWNEEAFTGFVRELAGSVRRISSLVDVYQDHAGEYGRLAHQITTTDHLIDQIVYRLYGLTDDEIAIVERT
jgi:hypothetical protein